MRTPILRYMLVQELDEAGRVASTDVERYNPDEFAKSFTADERIVLNSGKRVYRESRVRPGTNHVYADMVWATTRWHQDPTEQMVRAGVDEALHGEGVHGGRRWPDYIHDLWVKMREAAL